MHVNKAWNSIEKAPGVRCRLASARGPVGEDGAVAAAATEASVGLPQSACARPCGNGCDLLRAAHRLPVERAEGDADLFVFLGAPALSGMDPGRCVCRLLACGTARP